MFAKNLILYLILIIITAMSTTRSFAGVELIPGATGPYLGQPPPGDEAVIFAEGVISTPANEHGCTFAPDAGEFYFTRILDGRPTIMFTRLVDSGWTVPAVASFSGQFNDRLPRLAPDGARLFFESIRPWPAAHGAMEYHAWYVDRIDTGWSSAQPLPLPNTGRLNGMSVASSGRMYVQGITSLDWVDGGYVNPQPVADDLKGTYPFIAPDESYLLLCVGPRRNLAISYQQQDSSWSQPRMLTDENTYLIQGFPTVSPCGHYLFYTADHDIYWIDASILSDSSSQ